MWNTLGTNLHEFSILLVQFWFIKSEGFRKGFRVYGLSSNLTKKERPNSKKYDAQCAHFGITTALDHRAANVLVISLRRIL